MTLSLNSQFLSPQSKELFPLKTISDLEKLFEIEFISKAEPNLAICSIILGAIENSLVNLNYNLEGSTVITGLEQGPSDQVRSKVKPAAKKVAGRKRGRPRRVVEYKDANVETNSVVKGEEEGEGEDQAMEVDGEDKELSVKGDFPPLELDTVEALFLNFVDIIKTFVDLSEFGLQEGEEVNCSSRELVQRVSEVIWSYLSRSYKDSFHLQSLYTYLTGKKLDSFGVTMTVSAACQLLGLKDVQIALSEDHSWLGFGQTGNGKTRRNTLEVTWHGKGFEDRRGQEAGIGDEEESWLYLKGNAVYCSKHMAIAAIVNSINYTIHGHGMMYSSELIQIQQRLLWKLYDAGHLKKFLSGLVTLADLEELNPTQGKVVCTTLYQEAILSSRTFYEDMHIYPYTAYAAYCYRKLDFKTALKYWAHAARIVQKFRRSRSDEEIYRTFFEISTDHLQNVMKSCSTGFSANSINRDSISFANLMRLFDGICAWEERSTANIVHITWAKAWISAIGKFDYTIRRMVRITESSLVDASGKDIVTNGSIEDEFEKDSGIDEEDEPAPCVTLFSKKLHQIKDFFKREKFNPSAITLLLTAQIFVDETEKESNGSGHSVRTRRERLSIAEKTTRNDKESEANGDLPARKRAKLSLD